MLTRVTPNKAIPLKRMDSLELVKADSGEWLILAVFGESELVLRRFKWNENQEARVCYAKLLERLNTVDLTETGELL